MYLPYVSHLTSFNRDSHVNWEENLALLGKFIATMAKPARDSHMLISLARLESLKVYNYAPLEMKEIPGRPACPLSLHCQANSLSGAKPLDCNFFRERNSDIAPRRPCISSTAHQKRQRVATCI